MQKPLQDNVIDENEYEFLCSIFTQKVDGTKMNVFYKYENIYKIKHF